MYKRKHLAAIILLFMGLIPAHAQQEQQTEICIDFRLNSHRIEPAYMNNAARLNEIMAAIEKLRNDSTHSIMQVTFTGVASPEGNYEVNRRLADSRLHTLEQYVRTHITLPDSLVIRYNDHYIPWNYLIAEVESSDINHKQEVLRILHTPEKFVPSTNGQKIDSRIPALQALDGGSVWRTLNQRYFAKMRNACAVLFTVQKPIIEPVNEPIAEVQPVPSADTISVEQEPVVLFITPDVPSKRRSEIGFQNLYLKSNAIGWGMLISNLAVEADFAKHWSATLPVYYSAMNYFTSTLKFRALAFQPEVRYWLDEDNQGWFGGAHLGLAWFNYAKNGDYRYQDHNRNTPLWGGGISGGYRKTISRNQRWFLEFTLGTGVYKLHYDVFYNEPDGRRIDTRKRTFFGIDQAAISLAYRFDFKQKGGKQ